MINRVIDDGSMHQSVVQSPQGIHIVLFMQGDTHAQDTHLKMQKENVPYC